LDRGYRMVELLKQGQYQPMDVVDQVLSIFAGNQGHLDDVPRTEVAQWEKGFLTFMRDQKPEIRNRIAETKDLDDASMQAINQAIKEYKAQYAARKSEKREVVRV
jgi:F-type H+-transporting ATPase subunit alpha